MSKCPETIFGLCERIGGTCPIINGGVCPIPDEEDNLPESIVVAPGCTFAVEMVDEFEESAQAKGCVEFSTKRSRIAIRSDLPKAGKHHILFHEMVHLAVEKLKQGKFGISFLDEAEGVGDDEELFVELLSGALFPMIACSGLWNGVTPEEFMEFFEAQEEEHGEEDCDTDPGGDTVSSG